MGSSKGKNNFILQGSILAIAGILCRLIGMLYRLPLVDIIGTKGNGYYTSAYSIYNILLVASSYSLPTAMSKIISDRLSGHRPEDARTAMRVGFIYATLAGALMFCVLFFGADWIAETMNKPFLSYVLMTLAPTVWIMAYLGILRGFFQGTGNMMPTAISQLLEQVVNAIVSVVMAGILFEYGLKANLLYGTEEYSYAFGAAGGTIGTGAGALIALLFFILLYLLYGRNYLLKPDMEEAFAFEERAGSVRSGRAAVRSRRTVYEEKESSGEVFRVLLLTLTPILFSAMLSNINTVVDDYIFSSMMGYFSLTESVVLLWGIFGEYRIIFNIPVAIANSMSSSIIPSLSRAIALKDRRLIRQRIDLGIRFTMLIAVPAAIGMLALSKPICAFLFPSETTGILVNVVRIGSPAVVFFSLATITTGVLHGLGRYKEPLINALIGLLMHVVLLIALMFISPGIYSVMAATLVMGFVNALLNLVTLKNVARYQYHPFKTYLIPLIASLIMGAAAWLVYAFLEKIFSDTLQGRLGTGLMLCFAIGIAMIIYLLILFVIAPFTAEELKEMPMGGKIAGIGRKLHLLK